jgi:ABC-2 type transport system ATP-binding protein
MSIRVEQISKKYGTQKALDAVSFSIRKGEIVGLLGPNGAGKSTMMKIISCYIPPTSGSAAVCDFDILEQSLDVRKKVGYLPENNPLYLDMYVKEFLLFIAGIHRLGKVGKIRVAEMIDMTGLQAEQNKKIGALSKGYKQRVGISQALIHDPEVLILDEPTSGLDPNQIVDIRNLISNIGKQKTVMLSTHIMQEVEAICGRAIIIHKGIIVADDSTANLSRLAATENIILVEFDLAVKESLLKAIPGVKKLISVKANSWELHCDPLKDLRPDIFQFAVQNKLNILSMQKKEGKSIQEVFQQLTKD